MFTDKDLALAMQSQLIQHVIPAPTPRGPDVLSQLLKDSTEINVRAQLLSSSFTETGLKGKFNGYWQGLGFWLKQHGGDLTTLGGVIQTGRTGGKVTGLGNIAAYDDAFRQTQLNIGSPNFLVCKAVSNQLRFVVQFNH